MIMREPIENLRLALGMLALICGVILMGIAFRLVSLPFRVVWHRYMNGDWWGSAVFASEREFGQTFMRWPKWKRILAVCLFAIGAGYGFVVSAITQ